MPDSLRCEVARGRGTAATVASDFFRALDRFGTDVDASLPHLDYIARVLYGGNEGRQRSRAAVIPWRTIQELRW